MNKREAVALTMPGGKSAGRIVQVGSMLFSSSITGFDTQTGTLSREPSEQVQTAFANMRSLLEQAGANLDELGLVTVCITDGSHARYVDKCWQTLWPDGQNRPALKINEYDLPQGELVQIQVVGAKDQKRRPIGLPGFSDAPPLGVRLGNLVFSAPIDGRDPSTGRRSGDRQTEMRQAFRNMEAFVKQAGGTKADLIHVYIFVRGRDDQQDMLGAWLEAFPEDGVRPARKAIFDETLARDSKVIHVLCVAVVDQGPRVNLEVPGISKRHPNPMGAKVGRFIFSSGIGGDDPSGKTKSKSADVCAAMAFQNMRTLVEVAGGSLADIGLVSITVNDYADENAIVEQWRRFFPDTDNEPARHIMAFGGRGSYPVQVHVVAALERTGS